MSHEEQKVEAMEQVEVQPVEPTDVDSEVTAEQARIAELEAQLEAAQQASLEERERAIRAVAEMENLRRRAAQDVEKAHKFALEKFAAELLPVLDNLERGLAQFEEGDPHRQGMEMICKQFMTVLEKLGVQQIEALGQPFDPARHNAVMHVEDESAGENTVVEVFQQGYALGDKILRFAMVKVAN